MTGETFLASLTTEYTFCVRTLLGLYTSCQCYRNT